MQKFTKIISWAYLVFGIIFLSQVYFIWNSDREKAYFSLGFGILAVFMFFFKRKVQTKK